MSKRKMLTESDLLLSYEAAKKRLPTLDPSVQMRQSGSVDDEVISGQTDASSTDSDAIVSTAATNELTAGNVTRKMGSIESVNFVAGGSAAHSRPTSFLASATRCPRPIAKPVDSGALLNGITQLKFPCLKARLTQPSAKELLIRDSSGEDEDEEKDPVISDDAILSGFVVNQNGYMSQEDIAIEGIYPTVVHGGKPTMAEPTEVQESRNAFGGSIAQADVSEIHGLSGNNEEAVRYSDVGENESTYVDGNGSNDNDADDEASRSSHSQKYHDDADDRRNFDGDNIDDVDSGGSEEGPTGFFRSGSNKFVLLWLVITACISIGIKHLDVSGFVFIGNHRAIIFIDSSRMARPFFLTSDTGSGPTENTKDIIARLLDYETRTVLESSRQIQELIQVSDTLSKRLMTIRHSLNPELDSSFQQSVYEWDDILVDFRLAVSGYSTEALLKRLLIWKEGIEATLDVCCADQDEHSVISDLWQGLLDSTEEGEGRRRLHEWQQHAREVAYQVTGMERVVGINDNQNKQTAFTITSHSWWPW